MRNLASLAFIFVILLPLEGPSAEGLAPANSKTGSVTVDQKIQYYALEKQRAFEAIGKAKQQIRDAQDRLSRLDVSSQDVKDARLQLSEGLAAIGRAADWYQWADGMVNRYVQQRRETEKQLREALEEQVREKDQKIREKDQKISNAQRALSGAGTTGEDGGILGHISGAADAMTSPGEESAGQGPTRQNAGVGQFPNRGQSPNRGQFPNSGHSPNCPSNCGHTGQFPNRGRQDGDFCGTPDINNRLPFPGSSGGQDRWPGQSGYPGGQWPGGGYPGQGRFPGDPRSPTMGTGNPLIDMLTFLFGLAGAGAEAVKGVADIKRGVGDLKGDREKKRGGDERGEEKKRGFDRIEQLADGIKQLEAGFRRLERAQERFQEEMRRIEGQNSRPPATGQSPLVDDTQVGSLEQQLHALRLSQAEQNRRLEEVRRQVAQVGR